MYTVSTHTNPVEHSKFFMSCTTPQKLLPRIARSVQHQLFWFEILWRTWEFLFYTMSASKDRLVGLVVRCPARERKILGSNPAGGGIFSGSSHTSDFKLALQWLPCQAPGVIGSALGLVGPVSVCCDWVRWKVWSAASISVWQQVKLSVQIRPWDTLACCWDVKQPTNKLLVKIDM